MGSPQKKFFARSVFTASVVAALSVLSVVPAEAASNTIDTRSRASVSSAYAKRWLPTRAMGIGYTGNVSRCIPGTQSTVSLNRGAQAINFYRGLNGLDGVVLTPELNSLAQTTAMAMHANNKQTHDILPGMKCYSAKAKLGAATSNVYKGYQTFTNMGDVVRTYMSDPGGANIAVGHRRWLLAPTATQAGIGTTTNFNAINTMMGDFVETRKKPEFFGFPNAGYSPMELEPQGRWSVTASNLGYSFKSATVTVRDKSDKAMPVLKYPVMDGYAYNTIVFQVSGIKYPRGSVVSEYTVEVKNVKYQGKDKSFKYTTKLFEGIKPK